MIKFSQIFIIAVSTFLFTMCTKEVQINKEIKSEVDFAVYHIDTLKSNMLNKIRTEYKYSQHDNYPKRYLDIYYIIQDSVFSGEMKDLENYQFGVLTNAKVNDTLIIDVFQERGKKIITFFVYDEVQTPVTSDSVNLKYEITKLAAPTYIK